MQNGCFIYYFKVLQNQKSANWGTNLSLNLQMNRYSPNSGPGNLQN